jgi:hypothetical protein
MVIIGGAQFSALDMNGKDQNLHARIPDINLTLLNVSRTVRHYIEDILK